MIRTDLLGELKDNAAGLVAMSEMLASRRVGPKAVSAALASAGEACAAALSAIAALAADVLGSLPEKSDAASEVLSLFDRAASSVRALEGTVAMASASGAPGDAKTRLVLERAVNAASDGVTAALFVAELLASAVSPRTVSIRVADVLGYGPGPAEGPGVIRATLDAPPAPVATTDARLLRALVEMSVQMVAAAGVTVPHVRVEALPQSGARIRVGVPPPSSSAYVPMSGSSHRKARSSAPPEAQGFLVRRVAWPPRAHVIAVAAAAMTGATLRVDPQGTGLSIVFA